MLDDNGVLKEATYCCVTCVHGLPKKPKRDNDITVVVSKCSPPLALVNGHLRGRVPHVIQILNRTELSMVSLINCVYTLSMLTPGGHYGSNGTVFSVLNDVHAIATILPRIPSYNEMAILRSSSDTQAPVDFQYSPYKVVAAMEWLSNNNILYENVFVRPDGAEWENVGQLEPISAPHIEITADDCVGITPLSTAAGSDGHPVNPSAPNSGMTDVFLMSKSNGAEECDLMTQIEQIVESSTRYRTLIVYLY